MFWTYPGRRVLTCVYASANMQHSLTPRGHRCFCGHALECHRTIRGVAGGPCGIGSECKCRRYRYIPFRPEEVGEWWLPRRKVFCVPNCQCHQVLFVPTIMRWSVQGFKVEEWKAKCKCKCSSIDHAEVPPYRCKNCTCGGFLSAFLCVVCDKHWEVRRQHHAMPLQLCMSAGLMRLSSHRHLASICSFAATHC